MTEHPNSEIQGVPYGDLEQRSGDVPDLTTGFTTPMIQRMNAEAAALQTAWEFASKMARSQTVLPQYQRTHRPKLKGGGFGEELGDQAAINGASAIMYGLTMGIGMMQSLKLVHTIGNSCGVEARTMQALCERRGVRFAFDPGNDDVHAVVEATRPDHHPVSSEWTFEHAEKRGYTSNPMYKSHPAEMLRAKALAECCRLIAPDIILGLDYTLEELQLDTITVERVVKQGSRGASALREIAARAAEDAEASQEVDDGESVIAGTGEYASHNAQGSAAPIKQEPAGQPASSAQVDTILKTMKARGITGQDVLDELGVFLQRKISSVHKISADEAKDFINTLTPA
jgi:hypothetical protein